jgi:uncharacterized protein (TIGR02145 family)
MQYKLIPLFFLLAASFACAQSSKYVAVFETVTYEQNLVTEGERRVLTDELRRLALSVLPTAQFTVMTRDNITELLPPGKSLEECTEGQCLVEIGRNVSAEYAAQGTVNRFGQQLALTVECYETRGGKLIGSFVARDKTVEGVLAKMQEQAPELFGKILGESKVAPQENKVAAFSQEMEAVRIGRQVWTAKNLDIKPKQGNSWCYENDEANCKKYGRLYDWVAAINACPAGWHLPSDEEWQQLKKAAGGGSAGKKLKAKRGWNNNGNGTDRYGFSALPGGVRSSAGSFYDAGDFGYWWSSSENSGSFARSWLMGNDNEYLGQIDDSATLGFSVRCVKD